MDWLGFSFVPTEGLGLDWLAFVLFDLFRITREDWKPTGRGWFGYFTRIDLGEYGLLAYGGESQRGSVHVDINAHGCGRVTDWSRVREFGESSGAWITRFDLAHDDFEGERVNIQRALAWHEEGRFVAAGRPPTAELRNDLGSNKGKTVTVGQRGHGKMLRVYEKGKQLGDKASPWCRAEVELHNKGRVIPWDIATDPGRYFAGAYPCLAEFNGEQSRIRTNKKALETTLDAMTAWAGNAMGKYLNVMQTVHGGDAQAVIRKLVRPGAPKRLAGYSGEEFDSVEVSK